MVKMMLKRVMGLFFEMQIRGNDGMRISSGKCDSKRGGFRNENRGEGISIPERGRENFNS